MLKLQCPYCLIDVDETELTNYGEAHIVREGPDSSDKDFEEYLFIRKNPKGIIFERWRHTMGCGKWFHVVRCTRTLEVFGSYKAQSIKPPAKILNAIKKRRPDFQLK